MACPCISRMLGTVDGKARFAAGWAPEKLNPKAKSLAEGCITGAALAGAAAAIFGCPTQRLTPQEIAALHAFVEQVRLVDCGTAVRHQSASRYTVRTPRRALRSRGLVRSMPSSGGLATGAGFEPEMCVRTLDAQHSTLLVTHCTKDPICIRCSVARCW